MTQDSEAAQLRHKQFLTQVVHTKTVWGLTNIKRWATSSSSFFKKAETMPFWSDQETATSCAKNEWKGYRAGAIPLGEFLENWCAGLYEENLLVGTNWAEDLSGKELEPLELLLEIIEELKLRNEEIALVQYSSLAVLEQQVREMIEEEE